MPRMWILLLCGILSLLVETTQAGRRPDPCLSSPCQNGGTCTAIRQNKQYSCMCTVGYEGTNCALTSNCGACSHTKCVTEEVACSGSKPCCAGYKEENGMCKFDPAEADTILGAASKTYCENPVAPSSVQAQIANGDDATLGQFPWQAALWRRIGNTNSVRFSCGAVILSSDIILTAAHCVKGYTANQVLIVVGSISLNPPNSFRYISHIVQHPNYKGIRQNRLSQHDIALLKLSVPLTMSSTVQPACLPRSCITDSDITDQQAVISGFGRTETGSLGTTLQYANIMIRPDSLCQSVYSLKSDWSGLLCLDSLPGDNAKACSGDSGGPCTIGRIVHGVTSFGPSSCTAYHPFGYAAVYQYYGWILNSVQELP